MPANYSCRVSKYTMRSGFGIARCEVGAAPPQYAGGNYLSRRASVDSDPDRKNKE